MKNFMAQPDAILFAWRNSLIFQTFSITQARIGKSVAKFNNKDELVRATGYREWIMLAYRVQPMI